MGRDSSFAEIATFLAQLEQRVRGAGGGAFRVSVYSDQSKRNIYVVVCSPEKHAFQLKRGEVPAAKESHSREGVDWESALSRIIAESGHGWLEIRIEKSGQSFVDELDIVTTHRRVA